MEQNESACGLKADNQKCKWGDTQISIGWSFFLHQEKNASFAVDDPILLFLDPVLKLDFEFQRKFCFPNNSICAKNF